MRKLTNALVQVGSTILAGLILAAMGLVWRAALGGADYEEATAQVIMACLYGALIVFAVFVFVAKLRSQVDPDLSIFRFGMLAKTLAIIALVLAIVPLGWMFIPYSLPDLNIRVDNMRAENVLISDHAEFFIKEPESPLSDRVVAAGRCELHRLLEEGSEERPLEIAPGKSLYLRGRLMNPRRYRRFLESQYMTLQVIVSVRGGGLQHVEIPFTMHSIEKHGIIVQIRK